MTRLDRYFAARFVLATAQALVVLVGMFVVIDVITAQRIRIATYDIPAAAVAQYYLTSIPGLLIDYHLLASSALVAALLVYGRAAQDREIDAWRSSGVGLLRIARPVLLLALVLAAAGFVMAETVGVPAAQWRSTLWNQYFRQADASAQHASWAQLSDGWTCHVLAFNRRALSGEDVYIHRVHDDQVDEIQVRRIFWDAESNRWIIENGRHLRFDRNDNMRRDVVRVTQSPAPFSEGPDVLFALDDPPGGKATGTLAADIERAEAFGLPVQLARMALHGKWAEPLLAGVLALAAIPFALRVRSGGLLIGFGMAVGIGTLCLLAHYSALGLGYLGLWPPAVAASAVPIAAGIGSFATLLRADTSL